jgi:macrolide-specific efflux system membrane fusion protein
MKNKKALIVLGVLGFLLFLKIISSFGPQKQIIEQDTMLKPRDIRNEFRVAGGVMARNTVQIKSPIDGRIEEINVHEGDLVKKGQTLFWMSSGERASMIDAARAIGESELKRWQEIYKPTPVVAPMNGFIISRKKEPGQTIFRTDEVLRMADDLIVGINIDETDFRYIKIGSKVRMFLDAYPDQFFEGIIEHMSYDAANVNNVIVYEIKIRPLTKPEVFRSGMTVTTIITGDEKEGALSIPTSFITNKGGKETVMIKTGNPKKPEFKKVEVKTGVSDGKATEILSGLDSNETVVILKQNKKNKKKSLMTKK